LLSYIGVRRTLNPPLLSWNKTWEIWLWGKSSLVKGKR